MEWHKAGTTTTSR